MAGAAGFRYGAVRLQTKGRGDMKAMKWAAFGVPIALALAVAASAGSGATARGHVGRAAAPSKAAASSTINLRIGDVAAFTGPLAAFGPSFYKAAQMAVAMANTSAKAAGLKMHVTIKSGDEGANPQASVSAARDLAASGIDCLLGGTSTGDSIAMAQAVTIPRRLTQIAPTASSSLFTAVHKQSGGLTFRAVPLDTFQVTVLAHYIAQQLHGAKGKLVSVAGRNDSYGQPATKAFAAVWKKLGGRVQGPVLYDPNAASYDSEASQIVANNPRAIVIEDFPETYAKVGAALLRTGKFSASKLYTTSGFPATIPAGTPPDALNGAWVIQPGQPTSGKVISTYNKRYAAFPADPKAQQPFNTNNFDAAMLCILASAAAKSSTGTKIAKKVIPVSGPPGKAYTFLQLTAALKALKQGKDIDYQGVSGALDLNGSGDPTGGLSNISRYANGNLKLLRQVNYSRGKLRPVK
jgi:ABC-type branched-subunit amino acid transport system substrate-binding protein